MQAELIDVFQIALVKSIIAQVSLMDALIKAKISLLLPILPTTGKEKPYLRSVEIGK